MSRYQYYDDLSGDSSDNKNSSDESDLDVGDECNGIDGAYFEQDSNRVTSPIRAIIHADVDCFYCQCEILDRRFDPDRPIAIGQKHIVVTCNYAARAIGISKLMSREDAQRKCPYLLIVDGSDLERYRVHGRKIYEAFRRSLQLLKPGCSVCKGSMDEMTADITKSSGGSPILSKGTDAFTPRRSTQIPGGSSDRPNQEKDVFIFDKKDSGNRLITFVEDQTGAQTTFDLQSIVSTESPLKARIEQSSRKNTFLIEAANLALQVRDFIFRETGFTTTMGVSFNPLLAKLASGLRKPGKVNVLEPGPSIERLLGSMPLRKIPGIGSRTMKVLAPCLENTLGSRAEGGLPWTCSDLLQVPRNDIVRCLQIVKTDTNSSDDQCSELLELCKGQDRSCIQDDQGGLQKSLSVENSFRRGTLLTHKDVLFAMEDLYRRLPRLLINRSKWSSNPMQSFPLTLRLTIRFARSSNGHSRVRVPSDVRSQQVPFNGRSLVQEKPSEIEAASILQRAIAPIAHSLLSKMSETNATRINICLTNFQDIPATRTRKGR